MPRKSKQAPAAVKTAIEVRAEVKKEIKRRDNSLRRWKCLEETVYSEDRRRKEFKERIETSNISSLPTTIQRFIRTLKQSVRMTMRHVGGTPFSIIRQMFIHWDADKKAALNETDLNRCLLSLGVHTTSDERKEVIAYYSALAGKGKGKAGNSKDMISYHMLLEDIKHGEPSILEFTPSNHDVVTTNVNERLTLTSDAYQEMPKTVSDYVEAIRVAVNAKLVKEGGTFYSHLRSCFLHFDVDFSGALDAEELICAMRPLNITLGREQAANIINYYDRGLNKKGEFDYKLLLDDVVASQPTVIEHLELTGEDRDRLKATIKQNPFLSDQFRAAPSRVLNTFLENARLSLESKISLRGGSARSWLKEAFVAWDPHLVGYFDDYQSLQGAAKRIGIMLTADEAKSIIVSYDREGNGRLNYDDLLRDILTDEAGLLADTRNGTRGVSNIYETTTTSMSVRPQVRPKSAPSVYRKTDLFKKDEEVESIPSTPNPFVDTSQEFSRTGGGNGFQRTFCGTTCTSESVANILEKILAATKQFSNKTKGRVEPKDILLGSFMRYDPSLSGRVSAIDAREVFKQLRVKNITEDDVVTLLRWYDSNGSNTLDFHALVREVHGDDILMRRQSAPPGRSTISSTHIPMRDASHTKMERKPPPPNQGGCTMMRNVSCSTVSTAFDFATKDKYWNVGYDEKALEAHKIRRKLERRPVSAGGLRKTLSSKSMGSSKKNSASTLHASLASLDAELANAGAPPGASFASSRKASKSGSIKSDDSRTNVLYPENKASKQLQRALHFRQMATERSRVVQKLAEIERQRKAIQDSYKPKSSSNGRSKEKNKHKNTTTPGDTQEVPPATSDNTAENSSQPETN